MIVLNQQVQKTKKSQFPSSIHQPDFKKNITGWANSQEASTQKPFQGIFLEQNTTLNDSIQLFLARREKETT